MRTEQGLLRPLAFARGLLKERRIFGIENEVHVCCRRSAGCTRGNVVRTWRRCRATP